jgi:hypothetical protein
MFGWLKKAQNTTPKSGDIIFDLSPLIDQLDSSQKRIMNNLADEIHLEVQRDFGHTFGTREYKKFLEGGWIFYDDKPILVFGASLHLRLNDISNPYSGDSHDTDAKEYYEGWQRYQRAKLFENFKSFFPLSSLQSVYKLSRNLMPRAEDANASDLKILNLISIEAACHIILRKKFDPSLPENQEFVQKQIKI